MDFAGDLLGAPSLAAQRVEAVGTACCGGPRSVLRLPWKSWRVSGESGLAQSRDSAYFRSGIESRFRQFPVRLFSRRRQFRVSSGEGKVAVVGISDGQDRRKSQQPPCPMGREAASKVTR